MFPGAGESLPFEFNSGGRQGGVETPDCFNAVIEDALDDVILSWTVRGLGFCLDSFGIINHAIFADNIFLFAKSAWKLQIMVHELTAALQKRGLTWKVSSLQSMCVLEVEAPFSLVTEQSGSRLEYTFVQEMLVLGAMVTSSGSTRDFQDHRFASGEALFYKHRNVLTGPGTIKDKLHAWNAAPATSAIFAAESWHLSREVLHHARRWEVAHVRQMLKLRRQPGEGQAAYNHRSAHCIYEWFRKCRVMMMHQRVLQAVFRNAWREVAVRFRGDNAPLDWSRRYRDAMYWQTCTALPRRVRATEQVVQRRQGHRVAWEDVLVEGLGSDWRSLRDSCRDWHEWNTHCRPFVHDLCVRWGLPGLPNAMDTKPYPDASGNLDGSSTIMNQVQSNLDIGPLDALESGSVTGMTPKLHSEDLQWQSQFHRLAVIVDCQVLADL